MKRRLLFLLVILGLVSCGENSKIEDAIRANLKDPESAQFKNMIISKSNIFACVEWNAKNSMGGYGEWSTARLQKNQAGWGVREMQVPVNLMHYCAQDGMNSTEDMIKAVEDIKNGKYLDQNP